MSLNKFCLFELNFEKKWIFYFSEGICAGCQATVKGKNQSSVYVLNIINKNKTKLKTCNDQNNKVIIVLLHVHV